MPGRVIYIYGKAPASGLFHIDLIPEYDGHYATDIISLRLGVDIDNNQVSRKCYLHDKLLHEDKDGYSGIQPHRFFAITITVQIYGYEISIGGYATYNYRVPYTKNMRIAVNQDLYLASIEYQ